VLVGTSAFLAEQGIDAAPLRPAAEGFRNGGKTVVFAATDQRLLGLLALADTLKPEAADAVKRLRARGIRLVLLTGDHRASALPMARAVGIDEVIAEVTPAEKQAAIARWQSEGHAVAMVGDGVNDGPALRRADLGIALGNGADVAMHAATMTLIRGDLSRVDVALDLARATLRTVRQNLAWAFVYNLVGIPLAALGGLSPMIASAAMALSSVSVVANALRLRRYAPRGGDFPNVVSPRQSR
jgi:Cu+-exporting ATPase